MKPLQNFSLKRFPFTSILLILFLITPVTGSVLEFKAKQAFSPRQNSSLETSGRISLIKTDPVRRLPAPNPTEGDSTNILESSYPVEPDFGAENLPDFVNFVSNVVDGQSDIPQGVYVQGVLQLPIVQQPPENPVYVSNKPGVVTQYRSAAKNGITGLLAHNYLSGELFDLLAVGQEVRIVYGNRLVRYYKVASVQRFQKLSPSDLQSDYLDLSNGMKMTTSQVFHEFYQGREHVTFQTCLKEGEIWDWGLVFVVAIPVD
jgi:hypothetical protein